jgi:hypothetical protein
MTIRNAEARLPRHFLPLADANRRAVRSFCYGSVIFGLIGFAAGWAI